MSYHQHVFVLVVAASINEADVTNTDDLSEIATIMASALSCGVSLSNLTVYEITAEDTDESDVWPCIQDESIQYLNQTAGEQSCRSFPDVPIMGTCHPQRKE